jgi:hypothetical protein
MIMHVLVCWHLFMDTEALCAYFLYTDTGMGTGRMLSKRGEIDSQNICLQT